MDKKRAAQTAAPSKNTARIIPAPDTQCGEILAVLQEQGSITSHQAMQRGIMALPARIMELRQAGYPIVCTMQPYRNKHGKTVRRGVFTLTKFSVNGVGKT